ncbi:MAG: ABC transporter permease [Oscillibacter sp.]|nr:ABC transporter permease [Oscillibacter sp.]MBD5170110.1 ABC transporter permease [Oscillibacter sp.]
MGKYVLKRLLYGAVSAVIVVLVVMVLIYSLLDRSTILGGDPNYSKMQSNARVSYEQSRYEAFGYQDYVPYADYINSLVRSGELSEEDRAAAALIGRTAEKDSEIAAKYIQQFTETYQSQGYTITRLDADARKNGQVKDGGQAALYATRDIPLINRAITYFTEMLFIDNIHYVDDETDIGKRGVTFTWYDPVYNPTGTENVFSPALIGNGTMHKYLLYFDNNFPWIHQNIITLNLGESYTVNRGVDVFTTMTSSQGSYVLRPTTYPDTGLMEESADDLHTATYAEGSREINPVYAERFSDDYTNVITHKTAKSKLGFSFVIGIISTIVAYCLGLPIGLMMARYKDGLLDKIGTIYIVFIIAVPSLAYIFLFKSIGGSVFKLPTLFDMDTSGTNHLMYILPIVSLTLPQLANLMKWMRRYMIDQMNSDYVKFARSGGLTESEIFTKHIWKNAAIPITHGIPGSVIFAMTGAIITERVYSVPGAGNLLTQAINKYDNSVIVGVTLFYAVLSVVSIILGDVLMATVDPRISFTNKAR